ncbi:uncharacterized protein LOC122499503 [Leptopilina heterotoma]|uniref:uncharacterized protein LOC122499503 n=1 Tax=Leptopilina heterotoma TaxID=63436 RepID=UPI001CA9D39E|nr:uncharacterized protein LOC122499503 [Leptopilina heterotoma]
MENLQMALRYRHDDENSGIKSFLRGKSTRNQRIESFWRQFRQRMIDFYITLFKAMEGENILNVTNPLQVECLRYCFGDLIKEEIQITVKEWNQHLVRKQKNRNVAGGIPNLLYKCPEKFAFEDYKKDVDSDYVLRLQEHFTTEPRLVSLEFEKLADELLKNQRRPTTVDEAYILYLNLNKAIQMLEASNDD